MTTPTKPRWARMGGVVRRASWALAPTRSSTSSIASIERDNSDAASLKGSVRSVSSTPPTLVPPKPVASHPSPIPESPVQQNEIPQPATAVPSLVQAPGPDPEPVSSPVQEYTPPPLIDSTGVGPGGFTDDSDDLPQPQPIRDPSLLQYDSNDGHEPSASEPTAGTRSGGFDDDDQVLPQSQTIIAPSLHHTESADSSTPPVADTARVSSRGFNDGLPQPQLVEGSPVHESDDSANQVLQRAPSPVVVQPHVSTVPTTPEPIFAQPLVPTEPTTPILSEPTDNGTYFGLPIQDEPDHNRQLSPEPIEEFKAQVDDDIFAAQPGATEERNLPGVLPGMLSNGQGPGPVAVDDNEFEDAVQMPKPEPVAPVAPLVAPAYVPQFDADPGQEVWEGVAHQQEVSKGETSSRSRTASIHSMVAGELFADPMAPRITVSHHEHGAPQMPQPHTPEPYQDPSDESPHAVPMPLAPVHDINHSRSTYNQSSQTLSGTITGYHETEYAERLPLLAPAGSPKVTSYLQPSAASQNVINVSPQSGVPPSTVWPSQATEHSPRLHDFGWIEYQLPDSTVYYVHPTHRVNADIDLRDERKLDNLTAYLDSHRDGAGAPVGMELWLLEQGQCAGRAFRPPVRLLVNHRQRTVSFDQPSSSGRFNRRGQKTEDDQLDMEYRYWSFMEAHPAHTSLPMNARAEAMDALTWAWTDRLLPSYHSAPAPFAQEECQELMSLLRSFEQNEGGLQTVVHTRIVSRILLRIITWRQQYFRPNKPLPTDVTHQAHFASPRRPFRRALLEFFISCLCLGIPYLFFERGRQPRIDEESGIRSPGPMFIVGACACLTAAIVLSASVTFLSLPGLDNFARVAGFVAILFSTFSMVSTIVAIFRYKADMDHPISHVAGEGLMMLTRRSVVMALPLIFLAYAIVAFVTGIVLYSFWDVNDDLLDPKRPFEDYTKWTVIGVLGGLAGMLFTSLLLLKR